MPLSIGNGRSTRQSIGGNGLDGLMKSADFASEQRATRASSRISMGGKSAGLSTTDRYVLLYVLFIYPVTLFNFLSGLFLLQKPDRILQLTSSPTRFFVRPLRPSLYFSLNLSF